MRPLAQSVRRGRVSRIFVIGHGRQCSTPILAKFIDHADEFIRSDAHFLRPFEMEEGIGLTTLSVEDEKCRDTVNGAEAVDDIIIAKDQWKTKAGAFDKPLHAFAAVTLTPIFGPVDGDDGYDRFAVFLRDCIQGLAFPAAGWAQNGEKCHDNDPTFAWRDGGGANRWQGRERLLRIRVELERCSRRLERR